ncbi:hypothetical protein HMPREF0400_01005 [Fusobacterium periodonticum 1_1_41FAA]|uniref:Restriction enzyme, beta subunit n=2 Tax=Fusobacterium periodonticum TaxID=860 RepID=D6LH05_9FUSO|nr:hypothetical protein HMPREF0400_01005 [Fusobacterium periodonticum 1_1_41FAA]
MGDLFDVITSKGYDAGKLKFINKNRNVFDFIGRTKLNYGVQGLVERLNTDPNEENTISVSQIGSVYAQIRKNKWYSSQNIFVLVPKDKKIINLLVVTSINKTLEKYKGGHTSYPTLDSLKNDIIQLPTTKDGKIDFDFMDVYISELKEERISELVAYLKISGLDNYELLKDEKQIIEDFSNIRWKDYQIGNLFERVKTKKLSYKAKNLPKEPVKDYILPVLTSSFMNQGLNYYVPKAETTILKNVISIPSNSDVYRAYYQSREFTVLSDAYAVEWKNKEEKFESNEYLFTVSCINKVTDLAIYSYKNKLGGWNVVKNKYIKLPVNSSGEIDFEYMKTFIQAVKKLIIKDVVLYADKKIEVTKEAIENS